MARDYRVNEQIRTREVRVITDEGEQQGILPLWQALQMARERGLDLVEVAPQAVPPVCRLMDYGRFRYLQTKKEREARKSQKSTDTREIRFRTRIADHDRLAKTRRIVDLLHDGNKVKLTVVFRGREIAHPELGIQLLRTVTEAVKEEGKLEVAPHLEGRNLSVIVAPAAPKEPRAAKPREEPTPGQETETVQAQDSQGDAGPLHGVGNGPAHAPQGGVEPPAAQQARQRQEAVQPETAGQ
ncbi:MAG: translation initiation factor IF-3 [Chloroflexi bacterium]|nr:translation initiation factor IF-3 [Chloroflexota bacterium]